MKTKFIKLKKIEEIGVNVSYDFEVQNSHRIIAKNKFSNNSFYTSNCHHPDIDEFITAKQTTGRLTKFNMSVLITNEFMHAVKNNMKWDLEFPNYNRHPEEYKKIWDGNLKKWKSLGLTTNIYKTYDNANELWDKIMTSTYSKNEPGVLFIDTINKLNNLQYCEYINSSNPCGEQVLPISGCCLLGSINLTQFVDFDKKNWDYDKLKKLIPIIVRLMDNVNDKTTVPLESQKKSLIDKRRIGLGIMGYGSALMMMKIKYGSDKALNITDELMRFIANNAYQASALLAKEKGVFPAFNKEMYIESNYIKQSLDEKTIDMIKKYGIRNSHILSIQPTGNTSIVCNNISGGLEPLFMSKYIRTSVMPYAPIGLDKPKNIDWENKTYESITDWKWIKEGEENLLSAEFNGYTWKFDRSRGLLRENIVMDYAVKFLESKGEWDENAEWAATTTSLGIDEHVKSMSVISKYIDSAMSKTINLPNEYPYDEFKNLYTKLYETETIKGGTTYRAGTMTSVLSSKDKKDDKTGGNVLTKTEAPRRPKTLNCDIHHVTVQGDKWTVIIGLYGDNKDPYEVFAFKKKSISISNSIKEGKLTKIKKGKYDLDINGIIIENIKEHFTSDEEEALTRMISTALRHGASINFIYEQLQKSEGTIVSFSKAVARTLKKYLNDDSFEALNCPQCGAEHGLVMQEGCYVCRQCGFSRCS